METQREELIARMKRMSKEVRKFYANNLKKILKSNSSVDTIEKYISEATGNLSEKIKELIAGFLSLDKASFQEVRFLWKYLIETYASSLPYPLRTLSGKKEKKEKKEKEDERKKVESIDEYVDTIITWYKNKTVGDLSVYTICVAFNKGWNPGYTPKYLAKEIEEMLEEERNGGKLTSFTEKRARKKEPEIDSV